MKFFTLMCAKRRDQFDAKAGSLFAISWHIGAATLQNPLHGVSHVCLRVQ